ncbi:MAG: hypothetical protein WCG85_01900 [Polyangia bacterium]
MAYVQAVSDPAGIRSSKSAEWPGPSSIAALTSGELLRGTWFDRSAEYIARQRGESVLPSQFATT